MSLRAGTAPHRDGWAGDTFRLGKLRVDRASRRVWLDEREVVLPRGGLFDVLLCLCSAWSEADENCAIVPRGTLVRLPDGQARRVGYDDIYRLQNRLGKRLVENVFNTGYRLVKVEPLARKDSGLLRRKNSSSAASGERRRVKK